MSAKYSFQLESREHRRALPSKLIIGRSETETPAHVMLKLLAYVLFYRDRLELEVNLHMDSVPYVPALVQLDYELRPKLWVECGECSVTKLEKLAVKVPEADIWIVKPSLSEAELPLHAMTKAELRRDRYHLIGLDADMFTELCVLLKSRNELLWVGGGFDTLQMQFDFNGLWFDAPFHVLHF